MVVRTSFLVSLALAGGVGLVSAQGGQTAHADNKVATQAPAKPYELPYIGTVNTKWSLAQNSARLLLEKPVQTDLGLSDEVKKSVLKAYGDFSSKYQDLTKQDPTKVDMDAEIDKIQAQAATEAVAALTPDETARLNQLGVQAMSFNALRLPEVRASLGLTAAQNEALDKQFAALDATEEALNADLGQQLSQLKDPGANATADEQKAYQKAQLDVVNGLAPRGKALDEAREKDFKAFLETLTPAEKSAWDTKVRGKEFKA